MIHLQSIDHVTLFVQDIAIEKRYYEELFGFLVTELFHKDAKNLQLEAGSVRFFMTEDPEIDSNIVEQQHISFAVGSLQPVMDLLKARRESYKKGTFLGFKSRNYHWCEWRDPAGIRVECVEHIPDKVISETV